MLSIVPLCSCGSKAGCSRSSAVSIPLGAVAILPTVIVIPNSSARSCSSFSASSSIDGGWLTKRASASRASHKRQYDAREHWYQWELQLC